MFYITTSRPYVNSSPHLGTVVDHVYGDTFNRYFKRLYNGASLFSVGVDEHGLKILQSSQRQGKDPQQFVDEQFNEFCQMYSRVDIAPDIIGRTATKKHYWFVNQVWDVLEQKQLIYTKDYESQYCVGCEDFYAPSQLVSGRCPIHPYLELETLKETNFFFKLSSFKDKLLYYLDDVYVPDLSIIEEMRNIVEDIQDISISRPRDRLSWGVPITRHPDHIVYIWFEALLSYISCLIDDEEFADVMAIIDIKTRAKQERDLFIATLANMPVDLMIMGRDNAKFHLIIFPAILLGLDVELPRRALIHGMILDKDGRKFSKSLGNGVAPDELINVMGVDGLRFFILCYCNSIGDTNFDWRRLIDLYNTQLADNVGNLVTRITNLIEKYLDGEVDIDMYFEQNIVDLRPVYEHLNNLSPNLAFAALLDQASLVNSYLEQQKPWALAKDASKKEELRTILGTSAFILLEIAKTLSIFLPAAGDTIISQLTQPVIRKSSIVFPKIIPTSISSG